MRRIRATAEKVVFGFSDHERLALLHVLKFYPLLPITHHRLSKDAQLAKHQQLLEQ